MFDAKCTWDLDADMNLAQPNWKEVGDRMKERIDADLYDLYNGDDGPGFDEEFHAQLLAGAHLLDDDERELFMMGWKAAKEFYESKED